MVDWYHTNFVRGKVGNMLPYGEKYLIVRINGSQWVTGQLFEKQTNQDWKLIQIEQTGTKNNPWENIVVFEMLKHSPSHAPALIHMPPGDYKVRIRAQKGAGVIGLEDEFYIA